MRFDFYFIVVPFYVLIRETIIAKFSTGLSGRAVRDLRSRETDRQYETRKAAR